MTQIIELAEAARAQARRLPFLLGQSLALLGLVTEIFVIIGSSLAAGIAYHLAIYHAPGNTLDFARVGAVVALFHLIPRFHQHSKGFVTHWSKGAVRQEFYLWNMSFLCLLALGALGKISDEYSRGAIVLFYVVGLPLLVFCQHLGMRVARHGLRSGWIAMRRALLLGSPARVEDFEREYRSWESGLIVAQTIVLPVNALEPTKAGEAALTRALGQALQAVRSSHLDDVFLLLPWSATHAINHCADTLRASPVSIHLWPEAIFDRFSDIRLSKFGFRVAASPGGERSRGQRQSPYAKPVIANAQPGSAFAVRARTGARKEGLRAGPISVSGFITSLIQILTMGGRSIVVVPGNRCKSNAVV